jgi:hypothetical protein
MVKLKPIDSLPIDPLESRRLRIVLATIVINVAAVALLALAPWSDWKTGLALNLFDNTLLLGFVVLYRDAWLVRLMIFGLATGFAELAADAWLVDFTRTLDYSAGGGPMLWRSPIWMPIAWEIVTVQFGCLGLWLRGRFGNAGLAAVGVLGAPHSLVAIQRLPHDFQHAVLHHPWRIRHRHRAHAAGQTAPAWQRGEALVAGRRRRRGDFHLLRARLRHHRRLQPSVRNGRRRSPAHLRQNDRSPSPPHFLTPKESCRLFLLLRRNRRYSPRLLDSLSLPRHGESSGELGSVMI